MSVEFNHNEKDQYTNLDLEYFDAQKFFISTLLFSYSVGERPLPSVSPATKQKFSREQNRRGGGLVLECQYVLEIAVGISSGSVVDKVKEVVARMEGNETVLVEN